MDKLDKFLRPALAKRGLLGAATSAEVCFLADKWGNGRFSAISFSKGVLKLSVLSSSASSELAMEQETLIDHLNKKIGRESVKSVRIVNMG
jgi:hypothetical protein